MISERPLQKLLFFIGFFISKAAGDTGQKCSTALNDEPCPKTETCILTESQDTGFCDCLPGYSRSDGVCVQTPSNGDIVHESHAMAWTFTILILIAIVIVGVYFIYKLRVVDWLKSKLSQRYNRNYDDVMIGQDEE